ncbi:MAG: ABC transporter permease [Myxococcales bacterium]|nr:ABC transporter permease [Myxococcales bacterium]
MDSLVQDLRYGIRSLRKSPAFTAVAVLALALGIGANTVLFSVISFALLRPLPYPEADRLILLSEHMPSFAEASVAYLNFVDWKAQLPPGLFSGFAAVRRESFNLVGDGEPERILGRMASADLLPELGVQPELGRLYGEDDDKPGAPRTVVLTHGLWQRRFSGDPRIVGKSITMSGDSYTVIGVLPKDFRFLSGADAFVPLGLFADRYQDRDTHPGLYGIARMKPGVTTEQVKKAFDAVSKRLGELYPATNKNNTVNVKLLKEDQTSDSRTALLILWGAVTFVLLIAAANVSNLMLARATARQNEIAVRIALGASRSRIVRQLLTESALLALVGGAIGVAIASLGLDALSPLLANLPRGKEIHVDRLALFFTAGVSLLTGIGFGSYPALRASDPSVHTFLKDVRTVSHARLRGALVLGEVALSMVLLIGAGLLLRSFSRVTGLNPGFETQRLLTMAISLPPSRYPTGAELLRFESELRRQAQEVPGVASVAVSDGLPLLGSTETGFQFEGQPEAEPGHGPEANVYSVTPGYFETLKIPILEGRSFTEADRGHPVAMIDEVMARRFFPKESAIGKRFAGSKNPQGEGRPPIEIIGIAGHAQGYSIDGKGPVDMGFYVQYSLAAKMFPQYVRNIWLSVRSAGDNPAALAAPLRKVVSSIDPQQPVWLVQTGEEIVSANVANRRLNLILLGIFAAVALLLATVGIYGVMSYSVEQRTREIGIRMALGAERRAVLKLIVGQGARLAAIGIVAGIAGAFALSRVMASLLYGVSATDPLTYAGLALLLGGVAVGACWLPARRAVRVDPAIALRAE